MSGVSVGVGVGIGVVDVTQSVSPKAAGRTANTVSCTPPSAFDWLITQDCTLLPGQDAIAPANVIVERDVTLIISSGVSLKINSEHHLRIMKGGKVIVRTGGSFLIKERKNPPDWVSIGADHHFNGDLTFVHRANPGFLDVHFGASLSTVLGAMAYTITLSSYAESVKQVEILFALVVGHFVFKEGARIRAIWPGSLVMLIGMLIVSLRG